ncbi:MAG: hypothetical protein ACM359_06415 [Bacillota bacterium]
MRSLLVVILAFTALACDKTIYEVRRDSDRQTPALTAVAVDTTAQH